MEIWMKIASATTQGDAEKNIRNCQLNSNATCIDRNSGRVTDGVGESVEEQDPFNGALVTDNIAVKPPLIPQHILQQPTVRAGRNPI